MSRCIGDRRLWRLFEGDASPAARAHVASCSLCAARLRGLERDLSDLRIVLAGSPPVLTEPEQPRRVRLRWTVPAATLAVIVMLTWCAGWWWQPSGLPPIEVRQASIGPFIEGVSAALFPSLDSSFGAAPDRLSDLDDLQAALAWEWSCEELAGLASVAACDDDTFALLLGEL